MNVYADSSFLVSPYVQDAHKDDFLARIATRPTVLLTPFHRVEIAHAIYLHHFYKKVSSAVADRAWTAFAQDAAKGVWNEVEMPARAWEIAVSLARQYGSKFGVRTLDSLHVSCALELKAERFWTFDERQARLAEAVGLNRAS